MKYSDIYKQILNNVLKDRRKKNPSYSLRSFARSLDTSPTTLSSILSGKRPLTMEKGIEWTALLKLDQKSKKEFLEAISKDSYYRLNPTERENRKLEEKLDYYQLKLDSFKMISNWYHLGILNLTMLDHFQHDEKWIANELGISTKECEEAIKRLLRLGLLEYRENKYTRTHKSIETPTDIPSQAIRNFHRENIERAMQSLEVFPVEERDITSIMMPIDKSKLAEAKLKIKNFRRSLSSFLKSEDGDQVYSLNIQLFPQNNNDGIL
ncbi:MAG: TIGR02147 family protein [Bacteriovoracaceae bacterium]|nr:TIGR02147 family protein [Bacteriovoracaceae bacterium]